MVQSLVSLQAHFATTFAVIALTLTTSLSLLVGREAALEVEREIGRTLGEIAYQVGEKMDRSMWARRGEIAMLSKLDTFRDPIDVEAARVLLEEIRTAFPAMSWVGLLDIKGKVVVASDSVLEGTDIYLRPTFAEGEQGTFIGDVHEAVPLTGVLFNPGGEAVKFVDIAAPVHGRDGKVSGVLAAHLSWSWAREVEHSVLGPLKVRSAVEAFVVGNDRTVVLGPAEMMGQKLDLTVLMTPRDPNLGWAIETWPDGVGYLTGFGHADGYDDYPGLGWTVLVRQPLEEAYAPAYALRAKILVWGFVFSLAMAVTGWLAAGRITAPLVRIAIAADRIRMGGRGVDIPKEGCVREIHQLSLSLRALVDGLTRKQAALEHMEDKAYRDALTGLPNRAFLHARIPALIAQAAREGGAMACLYMDLDGFKPVNDMLGHHVGDLLLREVGDRLRAAARGGDVVARLGGDEFVVILSAPGPMRDHARMVAERIIRVLSQPMDIEGQRVNVGCSIGIALWPEEGADMETLMRTADCALYEAKRAGKRRAMFAADTPDCVAPAGRVWEDQA